MQKKVLWKLSKMKNRKKLVWGWLVGWVAEFLLYILRTKVNKKLSLVADHISEVLFVKLV
jgi:hypothetical protein